MYMSSASRPESSQTVAISDTEQIAIVGLKLAQACAAGDVSGVKSILDWDYPSELMVAAINKPIISDITVDVQNDVVLETPNLKWDATYENLIPCPGTSSAESFLQLRTVTATRLAPLTPLTAAVIGGHAHVVRLLAADHRCHVNAGMFAYVMSEAVKRFLPPQPILFGGGPSSHTPVIEAILSTERAEALIEVERQKRKKFRDGRISAFLEQYPQGEALLEVSVAGKRVSKTVTVDDIKEKERAFEEDASRNTSKVIKKATEAISLSLLQAITSGGPMRIHAGQTDRTPLNVVCLLAPNDGYMCYLPLLQIAVRAGYPSIVKYLLCEGAAHLLWKVEESELEGVRTCRLVPQRQLHIHMIQLNVHQRFNPLHLACNQKSLPVVKELLTLKTNDVKLLLDHNDSNVSWVNADQPLYDPNESVQSTNGWSPLMVATERIAIDVMEYLMSLYDATGSPVVNVNESEYDSGTSPLHIVAEKGNLDAIKCLLRHGADVDVCVKRTANANVNNTEGWTPMHFAAKNSKIDAIELLVSNGADVNAAAAGKDQCWTIQPKNVVPVGPAFKIVLKLLSQM